MAPNQDAGAGLAQLAGRPPLSHMLDAKLLYKHQTNRMLTHSTAIVRPIKNTWNMYIIHYLKHVQTYSLGSHWNQFLELGVSGDPKKPDVQKMYANTN